MGKILTIDYIDDLDGVPIAEENVDTVQFSFRGEEYTLVLTAENGAQFDKAMRRYIKAARKAKADEGRIARRHARTASQRTASRVAAARGKTAPRKAAGTKRAGSEKTRAIREWARANGHTVSERGRLSADVIAAYNAAQ
ncbi:Lsr2 family protein [Mycolicibacterium goodii]|uniref:histone-like nucleoid-structuring protein Lsr2 n=1 Tax=Mycolicibacterium goodii TaxID=134601 RepID=UPI001BDC7530|nr:Lsr2 family protein [Mycolicibacterium goodii]MBU8820997.1 Lsr2 family protein [Mycolicibacterium goodii]